MAFFSKPGKFLATLLLLLSCHSLASYTEQLTETQKSWLAERIFANECNRKLQCLTFWNEGEDFPSMGIGHFIWYRKQQQQPFEETFPLLLAFMASRNIEIPGWLYENNLDNPWSSREEFLLDINSDRLEELRVLLFNNMDLQIEFILQRFVDGVAAINSAGNNGEMLKNKIDIIADSHPPYGIYAMVDYVNFKGTGLQQTEQYNGQGWGLTQVLLTMPDSTTADLALLDFVEAARQVLQLRVSNAPQEKNEQRWLEGWNKRLETYIPAP